MKTAAELKAQILGRADEDGDFRARLIADPKRAVAEETGTIIPEELNVEVYEDDAATVHLVLPPSPELTEAELAMVAGSDHNWYAQTSTAPG